MLPRSCRFVDVQVDVSGHTLAAGTGVGGTLAGCGAGQGATFAGLGMGATVAYGGTLGVQFAVGRRSRGRRGKWCEGERPLGQG